MTNLNLNTIPEFTISGSNFKDPSTGNNLNFRCINFSGISKLPRGWSSHETDKTFDYEDISFINRPVSLDEADSHFRRLSYWGFTVLRFVVTWEALEPYKPYF
jgi:hypothetical protein